jgi:hypothetical protein
MLDSIFQTGTSSADQTITAGSLILALAAAFAIGLIISFVYMKTQTNRTTIPSFLLTLVILPAVISVIILLVGSNIARAFSLAGAFSLIRFRSAPGDPKDIAYVLFSLAVGLACGMGYMAVALLFAVIVCLVMLLLHMLKFGQVRSVSKQLKITIPENLDYESVFDDLLEQYTVSHQLSKVRTLDLGSLFELVYTVILRADMREKDLIDALRCRNGNLNITLVLNAQTPEYGA